MGILMLLIPLGLVLLAIAVAAFVWAVRHDQFEDLEAEGARILFDDEVQAAPSRVPPVTGKASE
jgi:cbb3-type cytochrome oxidase maturation protein